LPCAPVNLCATTERHPGNTIVIASRPRAPIEGDSEGVQQLRRGPGLHQGREGRVPRHPVLRPARRDAAPHRPRIDRRRHPGGRRRVRRVVGPRLPGDQRVRHGAVPGPRHGPAGPVPQAQDAQHELLRARPDHGRALQPRPPQRRAQGGAVPGRIRRRRHVLLRRRGRVLHSTRSSSAPTRTSSTTTSTRSRAGGPPAATRSAATRGTRSTTRAATSRCRRWTTTPTCATTWSPT
jgi:hypothetical protein